MGLLVSQLSSDLMRVGLDHDVASLVLPSSIQELGQLSFNFAATGRPTKSKKVPARRQSRTQRSKSSPAKLPLNAVPLFGPIGTTFSNCIQTAPTCSGAAASGVAKLDSSPRSLVATEAAVPAGVYKPATQEETFHHEPASKHLGIEGKRRLRQRANASPGEDLTEKLLFLPVALVSLVPTEESCDAILQPLVRSAQLVDADLGPEVLRLPQYVLELMLCRGTAHSLVQLAGTCNLWLLLARQTVERVFAQEIESRQALRLPWRHELFWQCGSDDVVAPHMHVNRRPGGGGVGPTNRKPKAGIASRTLV